MAKSNTPLIILIAILAIAGSAALVASAGDAKDEEIPYCDTIQSLENVQSVAPSIIDLVGPVEFPSNILDMKKEGVEPKYWKDVRNCISKALTDRGAVFITFNTKLEDGIKGRQKYIEVKEIPEWAYEITMGLWKENELPVRGDEAKPQLASDN